MKLTKKDFKDGEYVGEIDFTKKYEGSIEIEGSLGWVMFKRLWVSGAIVAERGTGILAGTGISAGWGISAGLGISAGTGISAKLTLKAGYRVFAGVGVWIKNPTPEQLQIKCGKFEGGEICYGNLVETGLPEESAKDDGCQHKQTGKFCSECGAKLCEKEEA